MIDANYWIKYGEWYDFHYKMLENLEKLEESQNQQTSKSEVDVIIPSDEDSIDNI